MTDRENMQLQVAGWIGIASLLFIMFMVAVSDEQRIMAFLFPSWLEQALSEHTFLFRSLKDFGPMSVVSILILANFVRAREKRKEAKNVLGRDL